MLKHLLRPEGRQWDLLIACVLPGQTELIFTVREKVEGQPYELAEIVERAKHKAGKQIIKKTEERFSPFYTESYDRIIRDDAELEERWQTILDSPVTAELVQESDEWEGLYVQNA